MVGGATCTCSEYLSKCILARILSQFDLCFLVNLEVHVHPLLLNFLGLSSLHAVHSSLRLCDGKRYIVTALDDRGPARSSRYQGS